MKKGVFVSELANVQAFLRGVRALDTRGADEACWLLNEGEPGYGKTRTMMWHSMQGDKPVFVRAKAGYTARWLLADIAASLNVQAPHSTKALFDAVVAEIMQRDCPPIYIDEIDHLARDARVLETLRDVTDTTFAPLIVGGMKGAHASLKRFHQIKSRIAEVVHFEAASETDVRTICDTLCSVQIADDLAARIRERTQGRLRNVVQALARVEASMKSHRGGPVTLQQWGGRALTSDASNELRIANG